MLCSFLYSPPGRLLWGDLQRSEWDNSRRFQPSSESIPWNGCHLSSFLHQHPETEVRCFSSSNVTLFWYIWQSSEDGITGLGAPSEAFFDFSSVIVSFIHCNHISNLPYLCVVRRCFWNHRSSCHRLWPSLPNQWENLPWNEVLKLCFSTNSTFHCWRLLCCCSYHCSGNVKSDEPDFKVKSKCDILDRYPDRVCFGLQSGIVASEFNMSSLIHRCHAEKRRTCSFISG